MAATGDGRRAMSIARWLAAVWLLATLACTAGAPTPRAAAPRGAGLAADAPNAATTGAAGAPSQPSTVSERTHVSIAYASSSSANSLFLLAQQQGIFQANGLDAELVYAPGNAGPAAIVSGQVEALSSGCAEGLGVMASGADLVYVLVNTNRMQYVLVGGRNVQTRDEIRGKRFGVSRIGTSSHFATRFIVKFLGLDPDRDVTYVQVGNTPERLTALLSGAVDGSILSVEEGVLVGEMSGMRLLVDMTQEKLPYCGNGMILPRATLAERPELVRALVRTVVEATARYKQDQAAGMAAVSKFLDEGDPAKVERIWTVRAGLIPAKPYPEASGLQFVIDEAAETDARLGDLTPERISDPSWVRALDEIGYIDSLYPGGAPAQ
jgi:ABC-type nitrate/sulfonate/bicarbonate transport system substrate-binding protein